MSNNEKNTSSHKDVRPPRFARGGGGGFARSAPGEKAKNFKQTLFRLLRYVRPYSLALSITIFVSIIGTLFSILSPRILGQATTIFFESVTDRMKGINTPIDFSRIGQIILVLIVLYIVSAVFIYIQTWTMSRVAQNIVRDLRNDVRNKISRLPLKYFDTNQYGDILSRATNDMDAVGSTMQHSMDEFVTAVIVTIGVVIMMLSISPLLTLIALIMLPLTYIVTVKISKRSQLIFARQQKELGILNGHVEEMYGGHIVIKSFGNENRAINRFKEINERLYEAGWRSQLIAGIIRPLIGLINNIGYILICVVGTILVAQGRVLIGDIQAFIQYSKQFSQPIVQIANIVNVIQSAIASAERVFELLDEEEEIQDSDSALEEFQPLGNVKMEHVSFRYKEEVPLMEDLNIDVKSGQIAAIVGPTGAGKTTLVNLLMRFYEVDGGKITIDGTDIRDIKRGTVRTTFGMVLQDTWLFKGTIRENIAFGKEDATDEEVYAAAKTAYADHFIRTLPNGYDTLLNEDVSNISQGQKQLITIARALIADPAILILDEATSNVDTRTELLIQKATKKIIKGRTSFIIAHRLSTIRDADLIIVMDSGDVVETGTHDELLARGKYYKGLYDSQFSKSDEGEAG